MRHRINEEGRAVRKTFKRISLPAGAWLVGGGHTLLSAALPSFPGAQGFGANAIGGRNGDVYHVTSLADTNSAGTLRNGINTANLPRKGRS